MESKSKSALVNRCSWCLKDSLYIKYHDEEWGKPLHEDSKLFEFLVLESMQAGLSWLTILKKRESFRIAFNNFDIPIVASYKQDKIDLLVQNKAIIRNKLKIKAAINNARMILQIQEEYGSFNNYIWHFVNNTPIKNTYQSINEIPASTELSDYICKEMKKKGFKFIGTTIIYSFMQAIGMVNDHITSCFRYNQV